ncbi:cation:proton antiporter [Desulfovibrio sp. OttesenSCG-928-I05]|nr:cation:proton antiporter [Desulfovibrio sp. OttesenSCG-928-I05]
MDSVIIKTLPESEIGIVVLALLILLLAALGGSKLAACFGMPKVTGEILGGLVIGPTILGGLFPEIYAFVFHYFASEGQVLSVFYWLGLILLMFTSGYEVDLNDLGSDSKIITWLISGATILPLAIGYFVSDCFFVQHYLGDAGNVPAFNIVFAIAAAVTSIPVISKIFLDLGLIKSRFAKIVLSAATMQDLFLWMLLSVAGSLIQNAEISPAGLALHVGVTLSMFAFAMVVVPKLCTLKFLEKTAIFSYDSIYFILCFLCICIGSYFGVNIMFSAFIAGLIFRRLRHHEAVAAQSKIKDLSLAFFTPVYFAIIGLRIHLTVDFNVMLFIVFLLTVSALELAGSITAMRLLKMDWLTSLNFGVAMNARGGPGIVLATVTYEMGIVNYSFFCVLILTTLITSTIAGWWLGFVSKKGRLMPE